MAGDTVRISVRMGRELFEWYREYSDKMGVPLSNIAVMALIQYRQVLTSTQELPRLIEELKRVAEAQS